MMVTSRRSLRRLRLAAGLTRYAVWVMAAAGTVASVRLLVAPPRPVVRPAQVARDDRAVAALATSFARAYLYLDGARPDATRAALAGFSGDDAARALVADVPPTVRQRIGSVDAVQVRRAADGTRVVTVAADTDRAGRLHLAVSVRRHRDGALRIVGAPALVGGPLVGDADTEPDRRRPEVTEPGLADVCRRALANYLAGAGTNLAADLSANARVTLPDLPLRLERVRALHWTVDGRAISAAVEVRDRDGVRYALRYELDVRRAGGRWEIAAVGSDPTA